MEILKNIKTLLDCTKRGIDSLKDSVAISSDNLKELVENTIGNSLGEIDQSLIECNDVITDKENTQKYIADTWIESAKASIDITTMPNDSVIGNDNIFILGKTTLEGNTLKDAMNGCHNLYVVDTEGWNENKNISSLENMCRDCTSIISINVSNIYTNNVKIFAYAFSLCSSLKRVDMRGKITSLATMAQYMFDSCYSLEEVDLSDCDTSNISDFAKIFRNCRNLKNVITDNKGLDISRYHTLGDMGVYNASLEHFVPYDGSGVGFKAFYNTGNTQHHISMSASVNLDEESVLSVIENLHKYEEGETDRVPTLALNQKHDKYVTAQHYEEIASKGWQVSGVIPSMVNGIELNISIGGNVKSYIMRADRPIGYRIAKASAPKGYEIIGWKDKNGDSVTEDTIAIDNMTYTAILEKLPVYGIGEMAIGESFVVG